MSESIIPSIAIIGLITIILYSLLIAVKAAEDSYPRRIYIAVLLFWTIAISFFACRQIYFVDSGRDISGYLYCNLILTGIFCQISLMAYAIAVLFHTHSKLKSVLIFLLPAIIVAVANMVWNLYNGINWFHYYPTFEELKQDMFSITVMLRISMLLVQVFYMGALIYSAAKLVPIYNRYLSNNQANEEYNLHWIYKYIIAITMISVVYFILAIIPNDITMTIYCAVTTYAFMLLTNCVWVYKSFPKFNEVNLNWSLKGGWRAEFAKDSDDILDINAIEISVNKQSEIPNIIDELNMYIVENKLYANTDLTMKETLTEYNNPSITSVILISQLAERDHTFQSFIRQIRIECAKELIKNANGELLYKDIFLQVGFRHYSSFSRAFTTVIGVSPTQYKPDIY
ncbi:MAG: helix-turn-helix domain-containing protein [Bacteroidales bacterium]